MQVICAADDNILKEMGIETLGDIVALRSFCKRKCTPDEKELQDEKRLKKKKELVSFLTSGEGSREIPGRKAGSKKVQENQTTADKKRRLELGWLHQYKDGDTYANVRAKDGGGTRILE